MIRWTRLALPVLLVVSACGPGEPSADAGDTVAVAARRGPPVPFELTERQERGREVFESVCWTCHGMGGQGNGPAVQADSVPPPPNFQTTDISAATVDELLARFEGAFEGLDEDHPHMAHVFSILRPEAFADAVTYIPALVHPTEIPGSAVAGQFEYERLCQACHGVQGEGDGDAASSLVVEPANFHVDTLLAARDWEGAFQRVKEGRGVHGSSMPPWGRVVSDADIWNLVAYIATFRPEFLSVPPSSGND